MKILFYISVLSALFITTSTAPLLGITQVVTVSFSPIIAYMVITFIKNKKKYSLYKKYNKIAFILTIEALIAILIKWAIGQDYFKEFLLFIFIPINISIIFEELSLKRIKDLQKIILFFFLVECFLAIYERIFGINFFNIEELTREELLYYNPEDWEFRSTSLLGHPLANAMGVTTILSFILTSNLTIQKKLFYFIIGYISLFCFNARGAIIITTALMIPYVLYLIKTNNYHKKLLYCLTVLSFFVIGYIIMTTSLGGRLFNADKVLDGSAQTRLDVFQFIEFINNEQLLFGSPDSYYFLTRKLEAGGVENGIISLIINWGLILTIIILPTLILYHYKKLSIYSHLDRIWIMTIFYILGTMNPNLATPIQWTIWIFAYYAFRSNTFNQPFYKIK